MSFPSCYSFLSYFFAGVDPIPDPLFPCRASKQPPSSLPSLDDHIPFALDPIVSLPLGPLRKRKYLTDVVAVREGEIGLEDGRAKTRKARDSFCRAQTIYSYRTLPPCPFIRVTKTGVCSSLTFRQFFCCLLIINRVILVCLFLSFFAHYHYHFYYSFFYHCLLIIAFLIVSCYILFAHF